MVLASSGMQADMMTLHKTLRMRLVKYQQNHQKDMSLTAASQMLSNMLYTRRFFPYYTFNVLGGIDEKGTLCSSLNSVALLLAVLLCLGTVLGCLIRSSTHHSLCDDVVGLLSLVGLVSSNSAFLCRVHLVFALFAGEGWAYGYDAIGSHEKVSAVCSGTGQTLIQPVLDNQIEFKQQWGAPKVDLSLDATVELIRDAFTSAGERDIYTGDYVEICKITKDGVEVEEFQLKFD